MELAVPVIAGLAVGVVFVLIFGFFSPLIPFDKKVSEREASLVITKSDKPWPSREYITLSKADLADHPIILYGIENAKLKHYICTISNCFASPVAPSYSFNTKFDEAEARAIITKYPFEDISPFGEPQIRNYGLHLYYDGDYYGMAISVAEAARVWIERP
jgi:hypothetical protein